MTIFRCSSKCLQVAGITTEAHENHVRVTRNETIFREMYIWHCLQLFPPRFGCNSSEVEHWWNLTPYSWVAAWISSNFRFVSLCLWAHGTDLKWVGFFLCVCGSCWGNHSFQKRLWKWNQKYAGLLNSLQVSLKQIVVSSGIAWLLISVNSLTQMSFFLKCVWRGRGGGGQWGSG